MHNDNSKIDPLQHARPRVAPGGLVTVAYMKANLDEGKDQLGIFMPLVFDVARSLPGTYFVVPDIQQALLSIHGVVMPLQAITTLLRRASRQHYVFREEGTYRLNPNKPLPQSDVTRDKLRLREAQLSLGDALRVHGEKRGVWIESSQAALDLILNFLEEQQVALLLGSPTESTQSTTLTPRESVVVAEFLHRVISSEPPLRVILNDILEGLVLYHAAFLPDLADAERRFKDLTVVFDSGFVRQALGYEGSGAKLVGRETIDLLRSSGVRCVVFDQTVQEIHRILHVYQERLATPAGRAGLRAYPMARHFITQRYAPSDVQEMSALLESEIAACGLQLVESPAHLPQFTHGEAKLGERLADRRTQDADTPRVVHDVDCVAGVLSLRKNRRSARIEDSRAVFATTAQLLIANTALWWELDEGESGIPPVVHVRSLANLAWLKKPGITAELQIRELVPLCAAAMRPAPKTWERFLVHLQSLQSQNRLSADQVGAIMVSTVSDQLLRDAELDQNDGDDIDAGTLDEVVGRVIGKYEADAQARAAEEIARQQRLTADAQLAAADTQARATEETTRQQRLAADAQLAAADAQARATEEITRQQRLAADAQLAAISQLSEARSAANARVTEAEAKAGNIAEELRRRDLAIDGLSRLLAKRVVGFVYWAAALLTMGGAVAILLGHAFPRGWTGVGVGSAIAVFVLLEVLGVLTHLRHAAQVWEVSLHRRFRSWLLGQDEVPKRRRTPRIDGETV